MRLLKLNSTQFEKHRSKMITFIQKNGDKRITKEAIQWVKKSSGQILNQEGTMVTCALENKKVIGLVIVVKYGLEESFIVVHKTHRNQQVAKQMVRDVVSQLGKIYGRIATDNIPSLKVCLENDMVAFHLFDGPTGKPTLWLGGGDWTKQDVL